MVSFTTQANRSSATTSAGSPYANMPGLGYTLRLFITDDHPLFIEGLVALLANEPSIRVVGEAHTGEDLLAYLDTAHKADADRDAGQPATMPHVVIMDLSMPGMGGIEAARQVRDKYGDEVRILIVTSNGYLRYVRQLTSFGVEGYLLKNTDRAELISAIRAVANGKSFFSQAIKEAIVNDTLLKQTSHNGEYAPGLEALSKREIEIVKLLAKDLSTHEIADQLCLSTHTIETHRKNILAKLGVRSAVGVVRFAIEHNLVE